MANKIILPIEIDDEQFRGFKELYDQFQEQLQHAPKEWKEFGDSASSSHEAIAGAAGALIENLAHASLHAKDLVNHLKEASQSQKDFASAATDGEITLKKMGKEAKEFADTIFGVGKFLMKIGVLGVGTAVGGLFGFDKLAESAVSTQRQARGLGLTPGQLKAFQIDFGDRYIDESTLSSIADARNDLTKQWAVQRATGLSTNQINQADVGTLAAQMALRAHDWWASTPDNQRNKQFYQVTGLEQSGFSFDQARREGNTDRSELVRASMQYGKDSNSLNVSDSNTDSLYAFMRDLRIAGSDIETYFSNKLADLGQHLGDFITVFEKDAKVLLDEVLTPENLRKAGEAIEDFTKYLGSDDFKKTLQEVGADLKEFGTDVVAVAKFIADLLPDKYKLPDDQQVDPNSKVDPTSTDYMSANPYNYSRETRRGWLGDYTTPEYQGPYYSFLNPNNPDYKKNAATLSGLESQYGLQPGLLPSVEFAESAGVQHALSPKGAKGPFQFTDATAADFGVKNPYDFDQSALGAAKDYADLKKKYGGDLRKELAAYNWGQGNLDADIKTHHADWEKFAPSETEAYINRVTKLIAQAQKRGTNVNITVTNKAGADVAVSTNAGAN